MSEDRLQIIKERVRKSEWGPDYLSSDDVPWLIAEVERLAALREAADGPSEGVAGIEAAKVWEEAAKIADKGASGFLCGAADQIPKESVTEIVNFAFRLLAKSFRDRALAGGAPHQELKHDKLCAKLLSPNNTCTCVSAETAAGWAPQGEPPK